MADPPTSTPPSSTGSARGSGPSPGTCARVVLARWVALGARVGSAGQSTVEYALVLLGAAALALLLVSWATGTDVIGRLFDTVLGRILQKAG